MTNNVFPLGAFVLTLLGNILVLIVLATAAVTVLASAVVVFGGDVLGL
ncbi:hypothetical protein [Microbacterium sp. NPDC055357]